MKKTFTLSFFLFLLIVLCGYFRASAQSNPNCQAKYSWKQPFPNNTTIQFTNNSVPADGTMYWTFGDGTSSSDISPKHSYAKPGRYKVCLTMYKKLDSTFCQSMWCDSITVKPNDSTPAPSCKAYFSFEIASGNTKEVRFKDQSNGAKLWQWDFGDGSSSTQQSPTHVYTQPGQYRVCLKINGDSCASSFCKDIKIGDAQHPNCKASFSFKNTGGNTVNFMAQEQQGQTIYSWDFGNKTLGNGMNVSYTYPNPGNYWVCLQIEVNLKGDSAQPPSTCRDTLCLNVTVQETDPEPNPCGKCHADFNFKVEANRTVNFVGNSGIGDANAAYSWTFGDGAKQSGKNVKHQYTADGPYRVCMSVNQKKADPKGDSCAITTCKRIDFKKDSGVVKCTADFKALPIKGSDGYDFKFHPLYSADSTEYVWDFSDAGSVTGKTVEHHYAAKGNYTVCLNIRSKTCNVQKCMQLAVPDSTGKATGIGSTSTTDNSFLIYPNPLNQHELNLLAKGEENVKSIIIYDAIGNKIADFNLTDKGQNEHLLSFQNGLISGMYFVNILTDKGIARKKLLVP